jgi:S1-C subfamily serine protease
MRPSGVPAVALWRAGLAALLAAAPLTATSATTAERVFAAVSRSVVVVQGAAQGSGVVVAPRLVATNCHVLAEAQQADTLWNLLRDNLDVRQVVVRSGRISHAAHLVRADRARDVCLLNVPTLEAPAVALGMASSLRVGTTVYAVGAPAGLELSLSAGLVSQIHAAEGGPVVQTTAPISPGSSGGGLFDERGRLVGLTTFQVARGQNLNFALPAEWVAAAVAGHVAWQRCRAAPEAGCLIDEALTTARGVSGLIRPGVLFRIAKARAEMGDLVGALATARQIVFEDWRAEALAGLARAQAQAGDRQGAAQTFAEALATARGISDATERVQALAKVARGQAQAGDHQGSVRTFAEAKAAVREIGGEAWRRDRRFVDIAKAQVEAGDITGALATAHGIGDEVERADGLFHIAHVQAQAADIAAALATARSIAHAPLRNGALAHIARTQAQTGDITGALATARGIADPSDRAHPLADIAAAQARAGDRRGAVQTFAEAMAAARGIAYHAPSRATALRAIAAAYAQAGEIALGLLVTREIGAASERNRALRAVAQAQARMGDIAGALATARGITAGFEFADALADIAHARAEAGDIVGALDTARGIDEARGDYYRSSLASALRRIAEAQARAGEIAAALETIETIRERSTRANALADLARHLAATR